MDFDTIRYEVADGLCRAHPRPARAHERNDQPDGPRGVRRARRPRADPTHPRAGAHRCRQGLLSWRRPQAFHQRRTRRGPDARREFEVTTLLHEIPAVTVAAINGACAGAGLGWALACDLRVMTASAKLNTAFLDVAVAGDMAIPWSLPRIVGAARARDLSFFPRRIEADEAERIGIVARVFADDTFRDDAESLLTTLLEKSPTALRGLKQNYLAAEQHDLRRLRRHTRPSGISRSPRAPTRPRRSGPSSRSASRCSDDPPPPGRPRRPRSRRGRRRSRPTARARGRVQRSGRRDVRPAQRRAPRRHAVHRGRLADHRRHGRRPPARTLGGRWRLHGDQPHRRPVSVPRTCGEPSAIRTAFEADDHGYQIWQLHPGDTGGSFLEIDFQPGGDDPNGPWMPAGPDWQRAVRTDVVDGITGVELAVPDPDTTAARWREILGQPHFDNAEIRWSQGTGGLVAVDLGDGDDGAPTASAASTSGSDDGAQAWLACFHERPSSRPASHRCAAGDGGDVAPVGGHRVLVPRAVAAHPGCRRSASRADPAGVRGQR